MDNESKREEFESSLIKEDEISSFLRLRNKTHVEKSVKKILVPEELDNGWEIQREGKNVTRLKKLKPHNVYFEDRIWVILAKMGFHTLNLDDKLKLPYTKDNSIPGRQIDVLAADNETILIVECKSAEKEGTKKSLQTIINDFKTIKRGSNSFLRDYFGGKPKIKFILATNNIIVSESDKQRLKDDDIAFFNQDDINYYSRLVGHLGQSAKYQLLGRLFNNQEIPNLDNLIPAIRGKMGGYTYYSFSIEPSKLLKISYILHSTGSSEDVDNAYQRMVIKQRLKSIGEFLNEGGYFPNSIIVNIDTGKGQKPLNFDKAQIDRIDSISDVGVLHLPKVYRSAFVIDGQHRLYGYANTEWKDKNTIPVVAFENLPAEEQIQMFVDINHKQKSVPSNLLVTLYGELCWNSPKYDEAITALQSRLMRILGEKDDSPLYRRIIVGENKKSELTCVSMQYVMSYALKKTNLFAKTSRGKLISTGPLWVDGYDKMLKKCYDFFITIFDYVKAGTIEQWNLGSGEGGFIAMNIGVLGIIRVSDSILQYLIDSNETNSHSMNGVELGTMLLRYYDPIIDFLNGLDIQKIKDFRRLGNSSSGFEQVVREFQKCVHERHNDFNPKGLEQWIRDNSGRYNEEAKIIVEKLETLIRNNVFEVLKREENYGERWWEDGIPKDIQKKSAVIAIDQGSSEPPQNFLLLLDYKKIVEDNWMKYRHIYEDPNMKQGKKGDKISWFVKLNSIRNKVSHPGRAKVTEEESQFLIGLDSWLCARIESDNK